VEQLTLAQQGLEPQEQVQRVVQRQQVQVLLVQCPRLALLV